MIRFLAICLALLFAAPLAAQETRVHGENSTFMAPGLKLGWAVQRGKSETETLVTIRVIAAGAAYRAVSVDGVDPFTKDRKTFVAPRPLDSTTDLAIPRAALADHPSTEFHFFASAQDAAANKPTLTVFYLGVPDTTPEFAAREPMEAYLAHALR